MFNFSCYYPEDVARLLRTRHPVFKNCYHPDGTMYWLSTQGVQDPDKPETWMYQSIVSWRGAPYPQDLPDQAARTAFMKKKAAAFAEPWRSAGLRIPEDLAFPADRCSQWKVPASWADVPLTGLVTLAGDAAHTMPPHRGQGLNNALEDAARLTDQIKAAVAGQKSLKDALSDYGEEMRERTSREVDLSAKQAMMSHDFQSIIDSPLAKMGVRKQEKVL
ncbi:hypothetical protein LTR50_003354 [Elasticomyces elasticus]|nr:hypothetical protein LTR50_003354 [Elasticomyces elasticus]